VVLEPWIVMPRQGINANMLISRFSLRFLFVLTTLASLFSLLLVAALRGSEWAIPVVVASFFLAATLIHFALAFAVIWLFTSVWRRRRPVPQSPFATDTLPRQVIPPTS
jgi:RsiW-degrading membrane proteinase PrsW (M82 family)